MLPVKSQIPFYKSYTSPITFFASNTNNFQNDDGGHTMAGLIYLDTAGTLELGLNLVKIGSAGNVIRKKVIRVVEVGLPIDFFKPTFDKGSILGIDKKVFKLDSLFNIQWSKEYYPANLYQSGFYIQQTMDSGYLASGDLIDSVNFGLNNLLVKLNNNGSVQWSKIFQLPTFYTTAFTKQTSDSGFISCIQNGYNYNSTIVKRDKIGQIQWTKSIDLVAINDMIEIANGDIVLTGAKLNLIFPIREMVMMKMSNSGSLLWSKLYKNSMPLNAEKIIKSNSGGFLISGKVSKLEYYTEYFDVFCLKTDDLGNLSWAYKYGNYDSTSTVIGNMSLSNSLNDGAFISFIKLKSENDSFLSLDALNTDSLGNISCTNYQSNFLLNTIDTIFTTSILNLIDSTIQINSSNYLVADTINTVNVIDCSTLGFTSLNNSILVEIFPNPTQGNFNVKIEAHQSTYQFIIYNALGELIKSSAVFPQNDLFSIDISHLPNGIYFIQIINGGFTFSSKIIKLE